VPGRAGTSDQVLVFRLDDREYGLPVEPVREIVRFAGCSPVPRTTSSVLGIAPVRGRMATLADPRPGLGLPPIPPDTGARVIVLESAGDLIGLVVDGVSRVARVDARVAAFDLERLLEGMTS